MNHRSLLIYFLKIIAIAATYFIVAKIGLSFAFTVKQVTTIWPPTGLAIITILILGLRYWPGIAVGAFIANISTNETASIALGIALGNTLEAISAYYLLKYIDHHQTVDRLRDILGFRFFVAPLATAISATVGTISLYLGGIITTGHYLQTWLIWWAGDMMGAILIVPLFLLWRNKNNIIPIITRPVEASILFGSLLIINVLIFTISGTNNDLSQTSLIASEMAYIVLPFVMWAAFRFGQLGVATTTTLVSITAIWSTLIGRGPFAINTYIEKNLLSLHLFIFVTTTISMILAILLSERKEAERKISAADRRFKAMTEHSSDAICIINTFGKILYVSLSIKKVLGYEPEEFIKENGFNFVHPEDKENAQKKFYQSIVHNAQQITTEVRVKEKGGSFIWVEVITTNLLHDKDIRGIMVNVRNINERKKGEAKLRFFAEANKTLVSSLDYEITLRKLTEVIVNNFADWCIIDLTNNDSVKRVVANHRDPEKNKIAQLLIKKYAPKNNSPIVSAEVIKTGKPKIFNHISENVLQASTENEEHFSMIKKLGIASAIVVPLVYHEKTLGAVTLVSGDENNPYTEEDLKFTETIANKIASYIENSRLYHEVQKADKAKDEFLATLSHELRNPLAPIINNVELIEAHTDEPCSHCAQYIMPANRIIKRQAEQLKHLLDDLLDVSRITHGKIELQKKIIDVKTIIKNAVETTKPLIGQRRQKIKVSYKGEETMEILGDPLRLEQVFINLINNASKYNNIGGEIDVHCSIDKKEIAVRIKDTGIGIPEEMLHKIFDLFMQVDKNITKSYEGLGIGLTLAKRLIEMHDGRIEAKSGGINKGSEFTVRIPVHESIKLKAKAPSRKNKKNLELTQAKRILIVDDNKDAAVSLGRLLEKLGYEVRLNLDSQSALDFAPSYQPEFIILDIGLPKMDGYQVAKQLKKNKNLKHTTLIALTGYGQEEDKKKAFDAGFNFHLIKPTSIEALRNVLQGSH